MKQDRVMADGTDIGVTFARMRGRVCAREPITTGVPFPRGAVRDVARLALADRDGMPLPMDAAVTSTASRLPTAQATPTLIFVDLISSLLWILLLRRAGPRGRLARWASPRHRSGSRQVRPPASDRDWASTS